MTPFRSLMAAALASLALTTATFAHGTDETHPEGIHIHDAYARISPQAGGVFFIIHNNTDHDITITGASSDASKLAELHTHTMTADGVMQMNAIEGGVALPYGEMHEFARGGDHVMLMGLTRKLKDGDKISVTLKFDGADPVTFEAVVDNARKAAPAAPGMDMGEVDHSKMGHSAP
jgi:copper(I)-binding protein